jgi:arylsulfatase
MRTSANNPLKTMIPADRRALLLFLVAGLATGCAQEPAPPPNILVIVADDLAYTDLGVYGGEIGTPNLDTLARQGLMFSQFYAAATCSPTRSMLFSGTDNHIAGLGTMTGDHVGDQLGAPGYETYLNFRVASMAEVLRDAGYHTYMAGKWHLGVEDATAPAARGFERSFALLNGGGGHFNDMGMFSAAAPAQYRDDGEAVRLPEDFYSTRFYADRMSAYIDSGLQDDRPFFGYLAFTAPHWPLQAPDSSIARYSGRYDDGFDALHESRMEGLKQLGLVDRNVESYPAIPGEPAWDELTGPEQRIESRKMEVYAAMVHDLDTYIGRVLEHLKEIGEYDNTFVFFMSDNGAEGHRLERSFSSLPAWIAECCDNSFDNLGRGDSYFGYGPSWARAGTGPFRMSKGFANEGGIRVPAIASFPGRIAPGQTTGDFATVMDVLPTLIDLSGAIHPADEGGTYQGHEVVPMKGRSMLPMFTGRTEAVHGEDAVMGWELFGRRAIRKGPWKMVWTTAPYGPDTWELFDLSTDPGEIHDLAESNPERMAEMLLLWEDYVQDNGVIVSTEPLSY